MGTGVGSDGVALADSKYTTTARFELRHADRQHAVVELDGHSCRVGVTRKLDRARERAGSTLAVTCRLRGPLPVNVTSLTLSRNRQQMMVVDAHVEVFLPHAGHMEHQREDIILLERIYARARTRY